MSPEQEIEQLRVMLARAWLILEELNLYEEVRTPSLLSYSWAEIREWLSEREILAARAWWDKKTAERAKEKAGAQTDNALQD